LVKGSPYVLQETDSNGNNYGPALIILNPQHDFVYVEYTASALPLIVGFKITPHGLVKSWQMIASNAGSNELGSMEAGPDYVVLRPDSLWVPINTVNQSGQLVYIDAGDGLNTVISVHVSPTGRLYYSCRYVSPSVSYDYSLANTVVVYRIPDGALQGKAPQPISLAHEFTSTDPVFVQGICPGIFNPF
jgi:hypothetical protein